MSPTGAGLSYSIDGIDYSNTTGIFTNVLPGNYLVTVKNNSSGCISTAASAVVSSATSAPNLIVTDPAPVCLPATVDLTAPAITAGSDPGLTFTYWTNASATTPVTNPSAVNAGTYYIKGTTAGGCTTIKPVVVSAGSAPSLVVSNPAAVCAPATVDLTAPAITAGSDPGLTYTYWKDAANTIPLTNPNAVGVTGTYYIKATSTGGCTFTKSVQVIVKINEAIQSMRYPNVATTPNTPTPLTARNPGANYTYLWRPPVGLNSDVVRNPIFNYNVQTEYTITITPPDNMCPFVDTVLVVLKEAPPACLSSIDVPKAWSPNSDGHNDKLYPLTVAITELKYFRVFNRWGQLMFETNIIGKGWDGIWNGRPQVMDVYTWTLEAVGCDGKYYKRAGNSALMR
jgi:gliding motility-associated-like protein